MGMYYHLLYLEQGDMYTPLTYKSLPSSCLLHWKANLCPITKKKKKKNTVLFVQQHKHMDRSSVINVTLCTEMMGKRDKVRLPTEKRHAKFILDPSIKTKRNEKVTEWLSLDLLGSLLQMFDWALQARFHGFKQEIKS